MSQLISVGQIIDRTWEHYHKHFVSLISVAAWLLLPTFINIIALALYPSATTILTERDLTTIESIGSSLWILTSFIIFPIVSVWTFVSLVRVIHAQLEEKTKNLSVLLKSSWKFFLPSVWIALLVALIILSSVLFLIPGLLFNAIGVWQSIRFLNGLGILLVFLGMLFTLFFLGKWLVSYALAEYALLLDNQHGMAGLRLSQKLIKGNFWSALVRLLVPNIVFFLVALVAESILLYLVEVIIEAAAGLQIDLQVRLIGILSTLISSLIIILLNPLVFTANILLYKDLQKRQTTDLI